MEYKNKIDVKSIEFKDNLTSGQTQGGMELSLKDGRLMCKIGETEIPFTGMIEIRDNIDPTLGNVVEQGVLYVFKDGANYSLRLSDTVGNREISGGTGGGDISGSGTAGQIPYFTASDTIGSIAGTSITEGILDFENGVKVGGFKLIVQDSILSCSLQTFVANILSHFKCEDLLIYGDVKFNNDNVLNVTDGILKYEDKKILTHVSDSSNNSSNNIVFFDATSRSDVRSSSNITFNSTTNTLTTLNINAVTTLKRDNKDVITHVSDTSNGNNNPILFFDYTSRTGVRSSSNLTFDSSSNVFSTPNVQATTTMKRNNKHVITSDISTIKNSIPFYTDTNGTNLVTCDSKLAFDSANKRLSSDEMMLNNSLIFKHNMIEDALTLTNENNDNLYLFPYCDFDDTGSLSIGQNLSLGEKTISISSNNTPNSLDMITGEAPVNINVIGARLVANREGETVKRLSDTNMVCDDGNSTHNAVKDIKSEIIFQKTQVLSSGVNTFVYKSIPFFSNSVFQINIKGISYLKNNMNVIDAKGFHSFELTQSFYAMSTGDIYPIGTLTTIKSVSSTYTPYSYEIIYSASNLITFQITTPIFPADLTMYLTGEITIIESRF